MTRYRFIEIENCEMCNDPAHRHRVLGQRLNKSQGYFPQRKTGISVSVKKCTKCDLIYSSPQPIPFEIQDHYGIQPEKYWKTEYFKWDPEYFRNQITIAKELLPFKNGMKSLDIGAGLGKAMLSLEQAGFDSYGLEPSKTFYELAVSKMNINSSKLMLGKIEDVDYDSKIFDFISFGAVFEHLYKPSTCLKKALKWLKPGGIIHMEVPSSSWLIPKLINLYYRIIGTNYVTNLSPMHPPYHLYEFGIKSFIELSSILNFTIEKFYFDVCSIYFIPKVFHPILKQYMKMTNTGMQLTVYLRK